MEFIQLAVLAIVQGITEFLPISSSAHLILVPVLFGWKDQGLLIDVALHVGTLAAVMVYFRKETGTLIRGGFDVVLLRRTDAARLALMVVVATVPVMVAGLLFKDMIGSDFRAPLLIAATTIVFGVALWVADRKADRAERLFAGITWRDAVLVGLAQALALIPGVSRSGITMTAALLLGYSRPEAARFALVLAIPTTFAAGALATLDLVQSGDATLQLDAVIAAALAFVSALAAIWAMMLWLREATFTPFVIYRLALGVMLLWVFL
ncbi:MAG: undecaprenyl-diphosphate phosphatase [Alphaproteobacteria bacterium]|nr:undecaprenyl-diphosphate phosphatase [Alphaproteobacteria bacterium]MDX5463774.1 undecaprenyl-diphosphate phosphatase [Alphaproteobacteria bacterium]